MPFGSRPFPAVLNMGEGLLRLGFRLALAGAVAALVVRIVQM